jgi:hypothetical protein
MNLLPEQPVLSPKRAKFSTNFFVYFLNKLDGSDFCHALKNLRQKMSGLSTLFCPGGANRA